MRSSLGLTFVAVWVLLFCALVLMGCTVPTAPPVVITTNVSNNQGDTSRDPASPGAPNAGPVVFVRTGLFGGACPDGSAVRAGSTELRQGCTGYATASPLGPGDVKLTPDVHGYECTWTVDRPDVVTLLAVDNPFNRDVVARAPGTARVSATVKGVTGYFDVVVR